MRNLVIFLVIIVGVGALFFFLLSRNGGDETVPQINLTKESTQSSMKQKQYAGPPGVLPEAERIGKKAVFETNQGNFTINLFGDKAPKTVSNFIFLAKDGFYNDLTFHRIIAGFMIQGGDPAGNGTGGPGYNFEDEFDSSLSFSKAGLLAMANSGPNTNGSQFFITVAPTPHLTGRHTIFGEVAEGYNVVEKISKVGTDSSDVPTNPVIIKKIQII